MTQSDPSSVNKPNREHRSSAALLCLCIGMGLVGLAYFLGVGGVIAAAMSGGDPAVMVGGLAAFILLPLTLVCGAILSLVGTVWLVIQVVADQNAEEANQRYKNVQR